MPRHPAFTRLRALPATAAAAAALLLLLASCATTGPGGKSGGGDIGSAAHSSDTRFAGIDPQQPLPLPSTLAGLNPKSRISSNRASLVTALLTLPSDALAGIAPRGRSRLVTQDLFGRSGPEKAAIANGRFSYYSDMSYPGDPKSSFDLALFDDDQGRTVAASHLRYPHAIGSGPAATNTVVYRLENGHWVNRTAAMLPSGEARLWYYEFGKSTIPCGPYVKQRRSDGRGDFWAEAPPQKHLRWTGRRFVLAKP